MKNLILVMLLFSFTSCVSDFDRVADAKKKYPNGLVTPSTGILKHNGYEITVEDTVTKQIYGISYYPFSTTKISSIVNIR
jgi:hypothetical protein